MADTFASALDRMARTQVPIGRNAPLRPLSLAGLRDMLVTWKERRRFRLKLEDMLMTAPHLIDDIGLTKTQVEAEIVKPFWRD